MNQEPLPKGRFVLSPAMKPCVLLVSSAIEKPDSVSTDTVSVGCVTYTLMTSPTVA